MHVAVGFMPAFKYLQRNSLIVLERGHKAHGYVSAEDSSEIRMGCPPPAEAASLPLSGGRFKPLSNLEQLRNRIPVSARPGVLQRLSQRRYQF